MASDDGVYEIRYNGIVVEHVDGSLNDAIAAATHLSIALKTKDMPIPPALGRAHYDHKMSSDDEIGHFTVCELPDPMWEDAIRPTNRSGHE